MFGVKFWGVRGSIPCPGTNTAKYGGNTACIEILTDLDYNIIIDLGTGVRGYGASIFGRENKKNFRFHVFLTHTHWDHITGFPFFGPIYVPTTEMDIYGPVSFDKSLEDIVGAQMTYENFPVNFSQLECKVNYHELKEGELELPGGFKVSFIYINHPILCLGYRFEYKGKVISTCYDHEPYRNLFEDDPENFEEGAEVAELSNGRIREFFRGSDILIHDAQYTTKEYPKFYGWGHSTFKYALDQAIGNDVKNLVFFHHDPDRTDDKLNALQFLCDETINNAGSGLKAFPASEGMEIILAE